MQNWLDINSNYEKKEVNRKNRDGETLRYIVLPIFLNNKFNIIDIYSYMNT